jgi:protein-S-isoprenylcysteine O-methyltransferase Ste14
MNGMRGWQIILLLLGLLAFLIGIPAAMCGVIGTWQIIGLCLSYFVFFLSTVWRTLQSGNLATRSEDRQVQQKSGRLAMLVQVLGLVGVHWLGVYDFSGQEITGHLAWNASAILFILGAIAVNQIAVRTLGRFFDRLTIQSEHQLVKTGIYSFVRHPIYLSYILLFVGFCLLLHSYLSLGLLAVVCTIWFGNRIGIEEAMLREEFGEEYQAYQQQTKRLIPLIY